MARKVSLLNPKAKIMKSVHSKINVMDILNTSLYTDKEEFWVTSTKHEEYAAEAQANGKRVPEACTARFDIKSFVYRARKPFHPGRLNDLFLEPYFADPIELIEEYEEIEDDDDITEEEMKKIK